MKIAYLSSSTIPSRTANSIHVMKMCQAFALNGHEVILLAPKRKNSELNVRNVFEFYGVQNCFRIKRFLFPKFIKGCGHVSIFPISFILWSEKPDIVYGRFTYGCLYAAALGFPVILESHGPEWMGTCLQKYSLRKLLNNKNFKKLVVISQALKDAFLKKGFLSDSLINVAYDGSDIVESFEPLTHWQGRKATLQVGYVGHLYPGKGMEIIARLSPMMPEVDFHVVGGDEEDIAFWRKKINGSNVIFHGFKPQKDISKYINALDICLLPNQKVEFASGWSKRHSFNISSYTSPMKMFNYMAQKKTIIASDLPALREVLRNDSNALLVPSDNCDAWVKAINILKDETKRNVLAQRAYDDFINKYQWRQRAKRVLQHIEIF